MMLLVKSAVAVLTLTWYTTAIVQQDVKPAAKDPTMRRIDAKGRPVQVGNTAAAKVSQASNIMKEEAAKEIAAALLAHTEREKANSQILTELDGSLARKSKEAAHRQASHPSAHAAARASPQSLSQLDLPGAAMHRGAPRRKKGSLVRSKGKAYYYDEEEESGHGAPEGHGHGAPEGHGHGAPEGHHGAAEGAAGNGEYYYEDAAHGGAGAAGHDEYYYEEAAPAAGGHGAGKGAGKAAGKGAGHGEGAGHGAGHGEGAGHGAAAKKGTAAEPYDDGSYYYKPVPKENEVWKENSAFDLGSNPQIPFEVLTMPVKPGQGNACTGTGTGTKLTVRCCSFKLGEQLYPPPGTENKQLTYEGALEACEGQGHRLCTEREIQDGRACGMGGCGSEKEATDDIKDSHVWTSTTCQGDVVTTPNPPSTTTGPELNSLDTATLVKMMENLKNRQTASRNEVRELQIDSGKMAAHKDLPFKIDDSKKAVVLDGWNLVIRSASRTPGEGNLLVGVGHDAKKATNSFVAGEQNTATGESVSIAGGWQNKANGHFTSVLGGKSNTASNGYSTVIGGVNNSAMSHGSAVSGGTGNVATGEASAVSGGYQNTASGGFATVGGGYRNVAKGESSAVGGGTRNTADGLGASIGSGADQVAGGIQYR